LPELPDPTLRVDSPELAYEFVARRGGAAYLPVLAVQADLDLGRLSPVAGAPVIQRPVYLIRHASVATSSAHGLVQDNLVAWLTARTGSQERASAMARSAHRSTSASSGCADST
jgi:DNA-binding transcriptional LysR family regulator